MYVLTNLILDDGALPFPDPTDIRNSNSSKPSDQELASDDLATPPTASISALAPVQPLHALSQPDIVFCIFEYICDIADIERARRVSHVWNMAALKAWIRWFSQNLAEFELGYLSKGERTGWEFVCYDSVVERFGNRDMRRTDCRPRQCIDCGDTWG